MVQLQSLQFSEETEDNREWAQSNPSRKPGAPEPQPEHIEEAPVEAERDADRRDNDEPAREPR